MPEAQTDVSRDVPQFPVQAHASSSSTTSFSSSYTSQFLPGHVAHAFYSPTGTLLDTSAMSSRIPLTPSESPSVDSPEMDVSLPELDVPVEQYLPVQELIASYEQTKDLTDSSEKHSSQRNTNSSPVQSTPALDAFLGEDGGAEPMEEDQVADGMFIFRDYLENSLNRL